MRISAYGTDGLGNPSKLTHYRPAMPFENIKKNILGVLFSSVLSKKYQPSGNLKFDNLGISQSLKFRSFIEKNPSNFSYAKFHSKYFGLLWVNCAI